MTLAIGPANYAQQAYEWTKVARAYGMAATSFAYPGPFAFRSHMDPDKTWLLDEVDDLLVDGFLPVMGGRLIGEELPFLTKQFHLGLIAHGSEMRDPDQHMARIECSYFRGAPQEYVDRLRWWSQYTASLIEQYPDIPIFVSTPDLLLDCPQATWLPLVVDAKEWRCANPLYDVPTVLHMPSKTTPPIKGTEVILPVLRELEEAGQITLVPVPDRIPHAGMKDLVFRSDMVVDQVLTGSYGVAACEAMAAGRVVVGHVAKDVRAQIGDTVPIVEAPGDEEFRDRMWDIVESWHEVSAVASQGPSYVLKWHSGAKSVSVLRSFVNTVDGPVSPIGQLRDIVEESR